MPIKFIIYILFFFPTLILARIDYELEFKRLNDYDTSDEDKRIISQELSSSLYKMSASDYNFIDSLELESIVVCQSEDQQLKLCTWRYVLSDGFFQYGGLLFYNGNIEELKYNNLSIEDTKKYHSDDWCGGVYYDIKSVLCKGEITYILLAWDGNNGVLSKKIIEVLSFNKNNEAVFGASIFGTKLKKTYRIILEYPADNSLLLKFGDDEAEIITNDMVLVDDDLGGYSVGDEFNVYRFERDMWIFYPNVDLRMGEEDSKILKKRIVAPSVGL